MIIYNMDDINYINKILYINSGLHIEPTIHFPFTKEFIFVDKQPRCKNEKENLSFDINNYNNKFIDDLFNMCNENNFKLKNTVELDNKFKNKILSLNQKMKYLIYEPKYLNPTLLIFKNELTGQTIKYYISTNIEYNMNLELSEEIEDSEGFIVSGNSPSTKILDHFFKSKIFLGYNNTNYIINSNDYYDEYKRNTITYLLYTNKSNIINNYFYKYYLVIFRNGVKIECKNYDEFYDNYKLTKHI